jgi:uncharacterized protein (TIGR03083 family)
VPERLGVGEQSVHVEDPGLEGAQTHEGRRYFGAVLREPKELVDAFAETLASIIEVGHALDAEDWTRPTGCPGWTVKDNVSHVVGLERILLGDPEPDSVPDGLPHITGETGRYMEGHVEARRTVAPADLLAELETTTDERIAQLRGWADADFDEERPGFMGMTVAARRFLPIRVFDAYAHEQDIRRATGRPGHLEGPAAEHSRDMIVSGVGRALGDDAAAVTLAVTGPSAISVVVPKGGDPVATLTTDFANFIALGCGRADGDRDSVVIEGDEKAALLALDNFAVTP